MPMMSMNTDKVVVGHTPDQPNQSRMATLKPLRCLPDKPIIDPDNRELHRRAVRHPRRICQPMA